MLLSTKIRNAEATLVKLLYVFNCLHGAFGRTLTKINSYIHKLNYLTEMSTT